MEYFGIQKYSDSLYQFKDPMGVLATLVIGNNKALLFDTCYGIGDLNKALKGITDKDVIVVNSHGHMDHTGGNYQFNEVWIHKDDIDLCKYHNSLEYRKRNLKNAKDKIPNGFDEEEYLKKNEGNLKVIDLPKTFDLGGITLGVIEVPGHTKGSIALYSKELRLMLVSDASCPFVWLFLKESLPVSVYIKSVEKILSYDFDNFLVGHGARLLPRSRMDEFLQVAKEIDLDKSIKVSFGGFDNLNSYVYTKYKLYDQDGAGVVFDPDKL